YREVLQVGAYPLVLMEMEQLEEILLRKGNDAQLTKVSPVSAVVAEQVDARLSIAASSNPKSLNTIDPERLAKRRSTVRAYAKRLQEREMAGKFRWSLTLYPTSGFAQDADMSLADFEEFVFNVCFLNDPDPVARWKEVSVQQQRFVDWLSGHKRVHIKGEGTDLILSIENRKFINSDGKRNFPSGEFFTSPVENSANGVILFDIPASYGGRSVEGVRLVFKKGKVVEASARQGEDYLLKMLAIDAGARYLGEFAFGNNPHVNRNTKNILFDEKMGGTVHLALGNSYPETGGKNQSALHWDMVCDVRKNGEVEVDDTLFLKDGKIVI
ncbi:MAG: aminopeptidase, partial [Chloroflexota bacterium]|nr:aminopeptidase [Chloroflexota bacterium]